LIEKGANIHARDDDALRWSSYYGYIEVVKFLINSDLVFFSKYKNSIEIVKKHKLSEFYEKFGIFSVKLPQSKNDILKYINSQDLISLKNCKEFDFSMNDYFYFFEALVLNNDEMINAIITACTTRAM